MITQRKKPEPIPGNLNNTMNISKAYNGRSAIERIDKLESTVDFQGKKLEELISLIRSI